jgi:hypothetical protein
LSLRLNVVIRKGRESTLCEQGSPNAALEGGKTVNREAKPLKNQRRKLPTAIG